MNILSPPPTLPPQDEAPDYGRWPLIVIGIPAKLWQIDRKIVLQSYGWTFSWRIFRFLLKGHWPLPLGRKLIILTQNFGPIIYLWNCNQILTDRTQVWICLFVFWQDCTHSWCGNPSDILLREMTELKLKQRPTPSPPHFRGLWFAMTLMLI